MLINKYIILVKTILLLSIKDKKKIHMHLYVYNYIHNEAIFCRRLQICYYGICVKYNHCLIDRLYKNYTKGRLLGINDI